MLTERETRLLTAAVDGELKPTEERVVRRLLHRSDEARKLFESLQHDSRELQALPNVAPPRTEIVGEVLRQIADRGLVPTPPPPRPRYAGPDWGVPRWAMFSSAASVLVAVCLGSYLVFAAGRGTPSPEPVAVRSPGVEEVIDPPGVPPDPDQTEPVEPAVPEPMPAPRPALVRQSEPESAEETPAPVRAPDAILSPPKPLFEPFEVRPIRLPLMMALTDLADPDARRRFLHEMSEDSPVRMELFCRDSHAGFDALKRAFAAQKQAVSVDSLARNYLKQKAPVHYAFYSPDLTAEEFERMLRKLGTSDAQKINESVFDKFVLSPFRPEDERELARLLGVPGSRISEGRITDTLGSADPRRSLTDTTAQQVAAALSARGRDTDTDESPDESPATGVLAVPFWPEAARAHPLTSKEIQQYLHRPHRARSGTIPILVVLRVVN